VLGEINTKFKSGGEHYAVSNAAGCWALHQDLSKRPIFGGKSFGCDPRQVVEARDLAQP
jgi:hypothetical protein